MITAAEARKMNEENEDKILNSPRFKYIFNEIERRFVRVAVQEALQQAVQLPQADPAGGALAAGLAVAQLDERAREVDRADADSVGLQTAAEVGIQRVDDALRGGRGRNRKSAQERVPPFLRLRFFEDDNSPSYTIIIPYLFFFG